MGAKLKKVKSSSTVIQTKKSQQNKMHKIMKLKGRMTKRLIPMQSPSMVMIIMKKKLPGKLTRLKNLEWKRGLNHPIQQGVKQSSFEK